MGVRLGAPMRLLICFSVIFLLLGCGDKKVADRTGPGGNPAPVVKAGTKNPKEVVQGVINALADNDYEAFKKFTCLGMTREQFKFFMAENKSGKISRVWDAAVDDFKQEFKNNMQGAFQKAVREANQEGIDLAQAKIDECEYTDDIKAKVTHSGLKLTLHLDDCLITPQGLLMFDPISAR